MDVTSTFGMINNSQTLVALYVTTLPIVFSGDLLVIGSIILAMGIYFENAPTIFFGLYDITLGAIFVKNTIQHGD